MYHHCCCGHEMHHPHHEGWFGHHHPAILMPREEVADPDNPKKEFFIGGNSTVGPVLEYMPLTGAKLPRVQVETTAPNGSTEKWSPEKIDKEYAVKDDFTEMVPGTRIVITVKETIARLRWVETMEYHHHQTRRT